MNQFQEPIMLHRRAYTLVELWLVIVILGILVAIVTPVYVNASGKAKDAATRTQLQTLREQIEVYMVQYGKAPEFASKGWSDLIDSGQLLFAPKNPLAGSSDIDVDKIDSGGWLWKKKKDNATYILYAVDASGGILDGNYLPSKSKN